MVDAQHLMDSRNIRLNFIEYEYIIVDGVMLNGEDTWKMNIQHQTRLLSTDGLLRKRD